MKRKYQYRSSVDDKFRAPFQRLREQFVKGREAAGLSQREVADRAGVHHATISDFETISVDPRLSSLFRYFDAIGLKVRIEIEDQPYLF